MVSVIVAVAIIAGRISLGKDKDEEEQLGKNKRS